MKNRKQFRCYTIIVTMVLLLSLTLSTISAEAAGLKLNKTQISMCTGKTCILKINGASKGIQWSTSNKQVVSIEKKAGKKCTIKGNKKGTATIIGKVKIGKKTKKLKCKVKIYGHSYKNPVYKWSADYSKCTATKKCSRCNQVLRQTVKTKMKTPQKLSCTTKGVIEYYATFSKYNLGKTSKRIETDALGHSVTKVTYKWNDSLSTCTAEGICKICGMFFTENATIKREIVTPATKENNGQMIVSANFKNKCFSTQTKSVQTPKLAFLDNASITLAPQKNATVKMINDTIVSYSVNNENIYVNIDETHTVATIAIPGKIGNASTAKVTFITNSDQEVPCTVNITFTPGDYTFAENISDNLHKVSICKSCVEKVKTDTFFDYTNNCNFEYAYYVPYGKNKGYYFKDQAEKFKFIEFCSSRSQYDYYYDFYNNQRYYDAMYGIYTTGTMIDKFSALDFIEFQIACERDNFYEDEFMEAIRSGYQGNQYEYIADTYGDIGTEYFHKTGMLTKKTDAEMRIWKAVNEEWFNRSPEENYIYQNERTSNFACYLDENYSDITWREGTYNEICGYDYSTQEYIYKEQDIVWAPSTIIKSGFPNDVTSNKELNKAVVDWCNLTGKETPTWYYYELFSDLAERNGRVVGDYIDCEWYSGYANVVEEFAPGDQETQSWYRDSNANGTPIFERHVYKKFSPLPSGYKE